MKLNWGIVSGDICEVKCDVVVNAANSSLLGGGGVDGAIHKAAGSSELGDYILANVPVKGIDPLDPSCGLRCGYGQAVITPSFKMKNCSAIIHTVGPIWHGGGQGEPWLLSMSYWNSLNLAKDKGYKSIAFPCISAGCYRFPMRYAADVALRTVKNWLKMNGNCMKVIFVVYENEEAYEYYEERMNCIQRKEDVDTQKK
jgi:O-acetyl-ADP-ribose deacetylase (regulator of RNase III)